MSDLKAYYLNPRQIAVGPGGSLAVGLGQTTGIISHVLGSYTGGDSGLYLHGGHSYALNTDPLTGYFLAAAPNPPLEIVGPAKFYLSNPSGDTVIIQVIEKISDGTFNHGAY